MAEAALPTEEEIDKMKSGMLTRLLREFGMTDDKIDDMEKEEANKELKKRVREVHAQAVTNRRPGEAAESLREILASHKLKCTHFDDLCVQIVRYHRTLDKRTLEMLKTRLDDRAAEDVLKDVRAQLKNDECPILVAGETSSGKSTFLNLLLGENILPVAHESTTSTICEVKYGETKHAVVHLRQPNDQGQTQITIILDGTEQHEEELKSYIHQEGVSRNKLPPAERVEIFWPLPLLEGGIVIVDSPGVGESDMMDQVVADYIPKCFAFLYIIDSSRAGGVQKDRLGKLLKHYTNKKHAEDFNPESAMFICNKWDNVPPKEQDKVKKNTLRKLSAKWPGLKETQLFYVSNKKAVGMGGILSADFTKVLDGLDALLPKTLENKLGTQYRCLARLLKHALDHVDDQINVARQNLDKEQKQKRYQEAQKNLMSFKQVADKRVEEMESIAKGNVEMREDFLYKLDAKELKTDIDKRTLRMRLEEIQGKFPKGKSLQDILKMLIDEKRGTNSQGLSSELLDFYFVLTATLDEVSSFRDHASPMETFFLQKMKSVAGSLETGCKQVMLASMGTSNQMVRMAQVNDDLSKKLSKEKVSFLGSLIWGLGRFVSGVKSLVRFMYSEATNEMLDMVKDAISSPDLRKGLSGYQLKSQQNLVGKMESDVRKMKAVMEQAFEDAFQDTRSNEELLQTYEPQSRDINKLLGQLHMFQLTEVRTYEYQLDSIVGWEDKKSMLGGGTSGKVYRARLLEESAPSAHAAVKTGDLITPETAHDFMREESNLRKLKGDHIVEYYGTACKKGEDGLRLGLVMELCEGTLESRIIGKRDHNPAWWSSNPEKQAAAFSYTQNLAVQLCEGLKHIHDAGYIHRDLKLRNILVTEGDRVKLAVGSTEQEVKITGSMVVGDPTYAAPEMKGGRMYDKSADIYSLGLILWEMWYGRTLFDQKGDSYYESMETCLKSGRDISMPRRPGSVEPIVEWTSLINKCLKKDPSTRPKIQDCLDKISAMKIK